LSLIGFFILSISLGVPALSQPGDKVANTPVNILPLDGGYGPTPNNRVLKKSEVVTFPEEGSLATNTSRIEVTEEAIAESLESRNLTIVDKNFSNPRTISEVVSLDNAKQPMPTLDRYSNSTQAASQVKGTQFTPWKVTGIPRDAKFAEAETSAATKGSTVFFTGNTYAARSTDGGKNWEYLDVNKDMRTCCDQDVLYDSKHQIFIWFRHGITHDATNKDRIGISRDTVSWQMYDIIPADLNSAWQRHELDYPHLALGEKYLYITTNIFGKASPGAFIIRISLDDLQNSRPAQYSYYFGPEAFTFTPVQGALDKMYWATHENNAQMRIFEWEEYKPWQQIKVYERNIPAWSQVIMGEAKCGIRTTSSLDDPRSSEWCSRSDSRIQSGVISRNLVAFFWDADALTRTERNATFALPYINAATFDTQNNMKYVGRPYVWSPDNAWLFASAAVNENGQVGLLASYGAVDNPPGLAFGLIHDLTKAQSIGMLSLVKSTHFPQPRNFDGFIDYPWGDYIRLKSQVTFGPLKTWEAAGFVLEGGSTKQFIQPYFLKIRTYDPSASTSSNDDVTDFMPPEFQ
jgi:hypothetical protein